MPILPSELWSKYLRRNLHCYDEALLRQIAAALLRPRSHWPVDELIHRIVDTMLNLAVIDRRLKELPAACRQVLSLMGRSRQPRWYVGNLIEMTAALGDRDGLGAVKQLLDTGLLFPDLLRRSVAEIENDSDEPPKIRDNQCADFDRWLVGDSADSMHVFGHPNVLQRATNEPIVIPAAPSGQAVSQSKRSTGAGRNAAPSSREADGLEWPIRLSVLWQQVRALPLRCTLQGDLYKRDMDRLAADPVIGSQPADRLRDIADIGFLTVQLAKEEQLLNKSQNELHASDQPYAWRDGLPATIASIWTALLQIRLWNASSGWHGSPDRANPYPSAYLLGLLILDGLEPDAWTSPDAVNQWLIDNHPFWSSTQPKRATDAFEADESERHAQKAGDTGVADFLLGLAYQLKLVQGMEQDGQWLVRLSPLGRWLLADGEAPKSPPFAQTFLVQPNLEVLVYRQGLSPELIGQLSTIAHWKSIGAACNMQLEPESVYAALEAGETFDSILAVLQKHGIKPPPGPVVDSLRTWAQKRERITVYPSALILEFVNSQDLEEAISRGVNAVPISDHMAVITNDSGLDYKHFRLTSNRDYELPPEQCVSLGDDGVTLHVDWSKSDLLLETELRRFADEVEENAKSRSFVVSVSSLNRARECGLTIDALAGWFLERCDQPLSPAIYLLMTAKDTEPLTSRRLMVVEVADEEVADGLIQWSETKEFFRERLGPKALVIDEDHLEEVSQVMNSIGIQMIGPDAEGERHS